MGLSYNCGAFKSEVFNMSSVSEQTRDFGRILMKNQIVKGVKLCVFLKDGRYVEYNNTFDPLFVRKSGGKEDE